MVNRNCKQRGRIRGFFKKTQVQSNLKLVEIEQTATEK